MIIEVVEGELVFASEGLDEFHVLVWLNDRLGGAGSLDSTQRCLSFDLNVDSREDIHDHVHGTDNGNYRSKVSADGMSLTIRV